MCGIDLWSHNTIIAIFISIIIVAVPLDTNLKYKKREWYFNIFTCDVYIYIYAFLLTVISIFFLSVLVYVCVYVC